MLLILQCNNNNIS